MKFPIKTIVGVVSAVIIGLTALNSYTIVSPGEAKVGTLFGKVESAPLVEGFHVVNPMVDFDTYSIKDITVKWDGVKVPAQDKLKSSMDLAVTFRAKTSGLVNMKRTAGTLQNAFEKYVDPQVYSLLRECGKGVEQSQDFFKDEVQTEMQDFMLASLKERLAPLGFEVSSALFSDISLPPLVQAAIEQTKGREEKVNQERAQLEIVQLEQQKAVKIAEAQMEAAESDATAKRTMADAAAYAKQADATAQAFAITTRADAQSLANDKLSKSVTPILVDYVLATRWDGQRKMTTVLGSDTVQPLVSLR